MATGEFELAHTLIPKYNALYDRAKALLEEYNPCAVSGGKCARGRAGGRNFCCGGCKYLGRHGCTVKALRCVLWTCHMDLLVPSKAKEFKNKMWKIFIEAAQLNLLVARGSMEDSIENACSIYLKKKRYDEYLPKITELTEEVTTLG